MDKDIKRNHYMGRQWYRLLYGDKKQSGLLNISAGRYNKELPEAHLLLYIVIEAAKNKDYNFLYNGPAESICYLTRVNYYKTMEAIKNIWEREDNVVE